MNLWPIGHQGRHMGRNSFVCLWFPKTMSHMTTRWSRSLLRHLQLSCVAMKTLQRLPKCPQLGWHSIICRLRLNDSRNDQLCRPVLRIPLTEVVGLVSPASLYQFVKLHLLLPKMLHSKLYCCRDSAHHPAGIIIFVKLAPSRIFFIIILVLLILPSVRTCKIAKTISNCIRHLLQCYFRLRGCPFRLFGISHTILLLLNCCFCVFNWLSSHSGLSFHIILNPFLLLFIG